MNKYLIAVLSILLSVCVAGYAAEPAGSGITFSSMRVIYPESETGGISYRVTNNTGNRYLLQSRVIPDGEGASDGSKVPFIVIPPLTRFEPGESVTLLIRKSGSITQADRESLWRLALKTIPAQSEPDKGSETAGSSLVLALQNNLKLFYRPAALPVMTAEELAGQLEFSVSEGILSVTNPGPYHVTFSELLADGLPVNTGNDKTLTPHSTARYQAGPGGVRSVSWSVVDDNGSATERREQSLH
ncbi:molecular chaperone [Morganella morganii]|uniref:fimbrial biogenesis chaperone n=1 Tax=Morganella morganii TaxID=582 RepID=UPI0021CEA451|nr:molecular chaperone [Morganella morganii]MCU6213125.1 molecular chaperone [Morganella morganii]